MDDLEITPGTLVRTPAGDLGEVERVVTDPSGIDLEAIVVRAGATDERYRVPAHLITTLRVDDGRDVVYLSEVTAQLAAYRMDDAPARERVLDAEPRGSVPAPHAGGLVERLQTGIDSLASGVRGALEGGRQRAGEEQAADEQLALRVPIVEEQIVARTEPVRSGTLRVRKTVETSEETITVPVTHEEPEVAYITADEYDPKAPYHPGETYVPIMGERLVVEKRQMVIGYLRVRKRLVSEDRQVTDTVRRERVTVEQDPPAALPGQPAQEE
jgi:uncharacterized protein (TIGR02271 family)